MSQHSDDFAATALADQMTQFGETGSYTPTGGDAVSVTALWGPVTEEEQQMKEGRRNFLRRDVTISTDEVAVPSTEAIMVDPDGETWAVAEILSRTTATVKLALTQSKPTRVGRHDRTRERGRRGGRDSRRFQT